MIKEIIAEFDKNREVIKNKFRDKHPDDYKEIVQIVIDAVQNAKCGYSSPDPKRIHQVDDGDYQGTLVFLIAEQGYQPSDYFYARVSYGSCSGCDTLEGIKNYDSGKPSDSQVEEYFTLALHVAQGIKLMSGDLV